MNVSIAVGGRVYHDRAPDDCECVKAEEAETTVPPRPCIIFLEPEPLNPEPEALYTIYIEPI